MAILFLEPKTSDNDNDNDISCRRREQGVRGKSVCFRFWETSKGVCNVLYSEHHLSATCTMYCVTFWHCMQSTYCSIPALCAEDCALLHSNIFKQQQYYWVRRYLG